MKGTSANSVYPDQTPQNAGLIMVYTVCHLEMNFQKIICAGKQKIQEIKISFLRCKDGGKSIPSVSRSF